MSKEEPVKYIKNKMANHHINNTYIEDKNLGDEDETDDEEEEIKNHNREYYLQTLNIIQKNMLEYVIQKSLPICEYLSLKIINNMLYNKLNF